MQCHNCFSYLLLIVVNSVAKKESDKTVLSFEEKQPVNTLLHTWNCFGENENTTQVYYCVWYCYDSIELCWENRMCSVTLFWQHNFRKVAVRQRYVAPTPRLAFKNHTIIKKRTKQKTPNKQTKKKRLFSNMFFYSLLFDEWLWSGYTVRVKITLLHLNDVKLIRS